MMLTSNYRKLFWVNIALLEILVLILYRNVFSAEYVWDDYLFFIDTTTLRQPESFFSSIVEPIIATTSYFRPVVMASFVIEFQLFEVSSSTSHAVNLFLHLANVGLVAMLAFRLIAPNSVVAAVAAVAFFALHPSAIESVAWVSGRFDVLVTFFILLAMVATLYLESTYRLWTVPICFFLAASCKEMAISFPVIWFSLLWLKAYPQLPMYKAVVAILRSHWLEALLILIAGIVYLALRIYFVPNLYHQDQSFVMPLLSTERLFLIFNTLYFYAHLVVLPFTDISPIHPLMAYMEVSSLVIGGSLAGLFVYLIGRSAMLPAKGWLIFLLLGVIALLPVLNIIPLTIAGNIGHDRFLLMPLTLFSLALGMMVRKIHAVRAEDNKVIKPGVMVVMIAWALAAIINLNLTVPLWHSNLSLWSWAYARFPEPEIVRSNLLVGLKSKGYYPQAKEFIADVRKRIGVPLGDLFLIEEASFYARTGESEKALDILEDMESSVEAPHELFLRVGNKLGDGYLKNDSGVKIWFYRGLYGALAETHLSLRNFTKASEYADITLFYQRNYPPMLLLKAMAEFGRGNMEAGAEYFHAAKTAIAPWAKNEPAIILRSFLTQYCNEPEPEVDQASYTALCPDTEAFVAQLNGENRQG